MASSQLTMDGQAPNAIASVTLTEDIHNIQVHQGTKEPAVLNSKQWADARDQIEDTCYFHTEEKRKAYDVLKKFQGFERAKRICLSEDLFVSDSQGQNVLLSASSKNPSVKAIIKFVVVKRKTTYVSSQDVQMTSTSINTLKEMEKEDVNKEGREFLKDYGSHILGGQLESGGCFEWLVTWEVKDPVHSQHQEKMARKILEECGDLHASDCGLWYNASRIINSSTHSDFKDLQNYQIRVSKFGGIAACVDFKHWKEDIMKSSEEGLSLVSSDSLIPMWEVIAQHSDEFQDSNNLTSSLQALWKDHILKMKTSPRTTLLELLGLMPYQERGGISLSDARSVAVVSSESVGSELSDIPWLIIEKLMRMDFRAREVTLVNPIVSRNKSRIPKDITFHPMDTLMTIFQSCDMNMKQVLSQKMVLCRLAIPFVMPFSHGELKASLWPLKGITCQVTEADGKSDVELLEHPFQIISFMRLGQISVSKSVVLNHIVSSPKSGTFFHCEAAGGKRKRAFSNGMVEMTYYIPKVESDNFSKETLVFNLRGDGQDFKQQMDLLGKISNVLVCFMDENLLLEDATINNVKRLNEYCPNLVVVLTKKEVCVSESFTSTTSMDESYEERLTDLKITVVKAFESDGSMNNAADLSYSILATLGKMTSQSTFVSLADEKVKDAFTKCSIDLEEQCDPVYHKINDKVDNIFKDISSTDLPSAKRSVLPLQGSVLKKYAKLVKDKHKGLNGLQMEEANKRNDEITKNMDDCRKEQFGFSNPLQHTLTVFIDSLTEKLSDAESRALFRSISVQFTTISQHVMPHLRQKYLKAWENRTVRPNHVTEAAKQLDDASLAIAHLFREVGQLYECLKSLERVHPDQVRLPSKLPYLAAQYFLSGHPLEFMDGDSGMVPLSWMSSVFDSLYTMIGDSKMYVLSVVGVQSSGKSTMLNTMFGLELEVGAGRCTRGVFAQLLPLDKARNKTGFDYVLVLDSEGLCSTTSDGSEDRDKEIATLVIGLSDLALINIKGENTQQMKAIIEVMVQAFLRMKAVMQYKKQKCYFLHQSVSAATAKDHLMAEHLSLLDHLDEVTKQAAIAEDMDQKITKFSDVIEFSPENNVFYIPDLWSGVPPMAQVSSGYSEGIRKVRDVILGEISASSARLTAIDMMIRLRDMWNAVLSDDFLFSFRNNLSAKAYLSLESQFYELGRFAESSFVEDMNNRCRIEIEQCEDTTSLDMADQMMKEQLKTLHENLKSECFRKLDSFCLTSDLREHLAPWKIVKKRALEIYIEEKAKEANFNLKYYKECKQLELEKVILKKYSIIAQIDALTKSLKGKQCDDSSLQREFTKIWEDWEDGLQVDKTISLCNVKEEIGKAVCDILEKRGISTTIEMTDRSVGSGTFTFADMKQEYLEVQAFHDEREEGTILKSPHNTQNSNALDPRKRITYFQQARHHTLVIFMKAKDRLSIMMGENLKFEPILARELLDLAVVEIDRFNALPQEQALFSFTKEYEVMVIDEVAHLAKDSFQELNAKFEQTASIKAKLEAFEHEMRNLFLSKVHEKVLDGTVQFLYAKMKEQLKQNIQRDMTRKAVDEILKNKRYKKSTLLVEVMTSLAETQSFEEFIAFTNDVYEYCRKWLETDAKKILFKPVHGTSPYGMFAKDSLDLMMSRIREAISLSIVKAKEQQHHNPMSAFVDSFREKVGMIIPVTNSDCDILKNQNITNFNQFQEVIAQKINTLEEEILDMFLPVTATTCEWVGESPYKQAMGRLWGCKEKCPLCFNPCVYTDPNHVDDNKDHECLQHWPTGFSGTRWSTSEKLMTDICTFTIATASTFNCAAARFRCKDSGRCTSEQQGEDTTFHRMRDYKQFLPHWEIEADPDGEASKYWQWAMYTFQEELARHHKAKEPDLPLHWNHSRTEAIKSLHRYGMETTEHDI